MVALSLLTDPHDGKPDNYIVRVFVDKDNRDKVSNSTEEARTILT